MEAISYKSRLRVYLAAPFAWQPKMRRHAAELRNLGIEITSRWLEETGSLTGEVENMDPKYCADTAAMDVMDIVDCNIFILFTPGNEDLEDSTISKKSWARGGRHFEMGLACGLRLLRAYMNDMAGTFPRVLVCGPAENIFCRFDPVEQFDTWDQIVAYLLEIAHANCNHETESPAAS